MSAPRNILSSSPAAVFILGAGFSKAISSEMPLMDELASAVAGQMPELAMDIPFFSEDIELALTFLAQPQPWMSEARRLRNRAAFLEVTDAVANEIIERVTYVCGRSIPGWLLRFAHWLHFTRSVVITLNYDTLLEEAMALIPGGYCYGKNLVPFRFAADGSLGGDFQANSLELLKLHGSVNWRYSGRSDYAGELIQWSSLGGWRPRDPKSPREKPADTVPLLVPPVTDKGSYFVHHAIRHLWRRSRLALSNAHSVFCVGYSLPATDLTMRFLLSDVDRKEPAEFYIVNRPASVTHYRSLLPSRNFRLNERFVGQDPVESFADALFTEEFFPEPKEVAAAIPGRAEQAVRQRLKPGQAFPTWEDGFSVVGARSAIGGISDGNIRLLLDDAAIPVRIPWRSLEALVDEIEAVSNRRLIMDDLNRSPALRACCDRHLGPWIGPVLENAGLVRSWQSENHTFFCVAWREMKY